MNTYKFKINLVHTWISYEEYECECEAENINEATYLAKIDAKKHYNGNIEEANHEDCCIDAIKLIDATQGEEGILDVIPRCDLTKEMSL